ncbi:MAG: response regulator [Acidobacteriaceae bacterium]|nr:response regulator [Acidobacteriaceae bacterium]
MAPASVLVPDCSMRESCIARFALDSGPDAILWADSHGALQYANRAAAQLLGRTLQELSTATLDSVLPDITERLKQGTKACAECVCLTADGREIAVEVSCSSFEVDGRSWNCLFLRDVSERRRLELQLRHAHTMEAVGRLVDGVSHDFNNLLTAVMIYSGLMASQISPSSPLRPHLDRIIQAAEDGRTLVGNLLSIGRKSAATGTPANISKVIDDMTAMLTRLLGEDIQFDVECGADVPAARIDRGQAEQIVLNLALNARDAMPNGGQLRVDVCGCEVDEALAREHAGLQRGDYVQVDVADSGCGMDADTLAHVFEPFFTTKPKGRGSGLGMATVYGVVQQCGGHIEVSSRPGAGTTVTIFLPQAESCSQPSPTISEVEQHGSETVLLVEDEEMVRHSVQEILVGRGYRVLEACNADEAESIAERFVARIHLMVTDLVLPGTGGLELAAIMRRARPEMRVLYISGYGDDARVKQVMESGEPFCAKPFTAAALSQKMREVLSSSAPQA